MKTYLCPIKSRSNLKYLFRAKIPKDLIPHFGGRRQFRISLKNVISSDSLRVSLSLRTKLEEIYNEVRDGMKSLNLEDIKIILRIEVRKQIEHSKHVFHGTNKWSEVSKLESLKSVTSKETQLKQSLSEDLKEYEKGVDAKLKSILESLDIEIDMKSNNYKQLRMGFIDLYLLRYDWMKSLINDTGKDENDFRREVDEKLKMNLFGEIKKIIEPTKPMEVSESPSPEPNSLLSAPISKCVLGFLGEKGGVRVRTNQYIQTSLNILIEDFGDIPASRIDKEKAVTLKSHMLRLPKNRRKNPKLKDKHLHELVNMDFKPSEIISNRTINEHLSYLSAFMTWCSNHGYANGNPFVGLKLKRETRPRDERDRFSDFELRKIFTRSNYVPMTKVEEGRKDGSALYWSPLVSLFSGMRLGEITPLYLDNIKKIKSIWCIDICEEDGRTDKKLKNFASRRIVPISETLIELGFIEFIELLKKKNPNRKRIFEELPYVGGHYNKNISRFWNERLLKKLEIKTDKKNFHSLRHTAIDHLKQKGIDLNFINELVGHSSGNIDLDRYGKGYNPNLLFKKCIKRFNYQVNRKSIDFKSLKIDWKKIINHKGDR